MTEQLLSHSEWEREQKPTKEQLFERVAGFVHTFIDGADMTVGELKREFAQWGALHKKNMIKNAQDAVRERHDNPRDIHDEYLAFFLERSSKDDQAQAYLNEKWVYLLDTYAKNDTEKLSDLVKRLESEIRS